MTARHPGSKIAKQLETMNIALCIFAREVNFCLICPQKISIEALWNIQVVLGKLETCHNVFVDRRGFLCGVLLITLFLFSAF